MRRFGRGAAFALAALTVAGCATSSPVPTFDLTAPREFPLPRGAVRGQLVVPEPAALAILDTERIVVRPGGDQVAQLSDAQWVDRLPKLLQARLVQAFENANRLRAVGRPGERIVPDYQLVVDVRRFNLTVDGAARAEVELSAKLVADASGRAVASRVFRASVPAAASEGEAAVQAIDAAFNQVVTDLVVWASRRL
ncbi:MAG TPA: ABC-type transport auxiliary lipoprotein family protein [Xanthobacteraceae bacterium]|nr:ABC-type transport auxiliary lipoprotein family protein [Xanthobacteraceae bacterium]